MRGKVSILLIVGLVAVLWAVTALAQAEEPKAQLYFVEDVVAKPSMVAEYEAIIKEVVPLCTQHEFPYPFYTYSTDDFHYYFVYPVENYADIDNLHKAWDELGKKIGVKKWQAMMDRFVGTFEYYQYSVIRYLPELSYTPEKPRLKPEEANFVYWEFFSILIGKEKEFAETCQEWIELYKSQKISDGWETYVGETGIELPIYIFIERAKSAVDYYSQSEKIMKLLGEKLKPLVAKTYAICKKVELKTGRFHPGLSYMPEEK
ncbi:MAG: hypothetical protein ACETWC_09805 [Acidobacteriota bacterium]